MTSTASPRPVRTVPRETRHFLASTRVNLNGNPARITGVDSYFATVTDLRTGLSAEWSWVAVERIVTVNGGRFVTVA